MRFVVAGVFTKQIINGLNIQQSMNIYNANSTEEAIGKYILEFSKIFTEHSLFAHPVCIKIEDND